MEWIFQKFIEVDGDKLTIAGISKQYLKVFCLAFVLGHCIAVTIKT